MTFIKCPSLSSFCSCPLFFFFLFFPTFLLGFLYFLFFSQFPFFLAAWRLSLSPFPLFLVLSSHLSELRATTSTAFLWPSAPVLPASARSPLLGLAGSSFVQVSVAGSPGWRVHKLRAGCLPFLCPRVEAGSLEPTLPEVPSHPLRAPALPTLSGAAVAEDLEGGRCRRCGKAHLPCPW